MHQGAISGASFLDEDQVSDLQLVPPSYLYSDSEG